MKKAFFIFCLAPLGSELFVLNGLHDVFYVNFFFKFDTEDNYSEDTIGNLSAKLWQLDLETRQKARKLCWETMFGQELVKLTVADFVSNFYFSY